MATVGIRALKQNASSVVEQAASGEPVTITDRGVPVALLVGIATDRLSALVASGLARPPRRSIASLDRPRKATGPTLSQVVTEMRDDERY